MEALNKMIVRVQTKASRETLRTIKHLQHQMRNTSDLEQKILFIFGCQRSGTSLVTKIFEKDRDTKVFYEFSSLSSDDAVKGLRLNAFGDVSEQIRRSKAPLVISKPLVESQNLDKILAYFHNAKAIWMYRHYVDVTSSNLKRWGPANGISDLHPIFVADKNNWRSEGASSEVVQVIQQYYSADMKGQDAAALFWYARNAIAFELSIKNRSNIMMCKYEDLVSQPDPVMRRVYDYLERPYPGPHITEMVSDSSIGKGQDINLSPEIEALCADMLAKLDSLYIETSLLKPE